MALPKRKTEKPVTAAQIRRIHTVVHLLNIPDDNYRDCLESRFGVTSSKNLTLMQAKSFIDELDALALKLQGERHQTQWDADRQKAEEAEAQRPKRFDHLDNRPGMASGAQLRKIEAMWADISIIPDYDARARALRRFILRTANVADMRFLTMEDAGKVIEALKAMQKREHDQANGTNPQNAA